MTDCRLVDKETVKETLGIKSDQGAYRVIRQLNDELKSKGCRVVRGRVSYQYLLDRYFPNKDGGEE